MRTGTTFLFNLLAQDDSLFAPPVWQMLNPKPLNNNAFEKESRVGHALQNIDLLNMCFPDIKKTHPFDALGPEECEVQFLRCFVSRDLPLMAYKKLLSYMSWYQTLDDETLARLYRHYDLEIKAFIYQMGKVQKRVLRKDSNHMSFIRQLMATYPDAKIVHTVRDPTSFVPSSCSVNETYAEQYYFKSDIEPLVISHRVLKHMKHEAECFTSFRKSYDVNNQGKGACTFLDINFRDLVKSPMATVRSIFAHIGKELSPKAEFAMRQYIKDNPQHKHGVHSYSLEKYGLEADLLRNEFKEYIQYFNVKCDK
ncbi:unnamed protein product [Owenia fusiformis]|uniref:Uncharacterized protein n=1 Tax=Owenia fusiformis TaxID=6347 RepID=A0A8J1XL11_OWEFU|nr:unnamed protein product [Owenia fusiformis]